MKKIKKGDRIIKVTDGAFEENFKHNGWEEVKEPTAKKEDKAPEEEILTEEEKQINELEAKPLSKWSAAEVKQYADFKEIDISGTKNVKEAKDIIKDFLE